MENIENKEIAETKRKVKVSKKTKVIIGAVSGAAIALAAGFGIMKLVSKIKGEKAAE